MGTNYQARVDGQEGKVYYNNLLNAAQYIKQYYPPTAGESASEYARRSKIAVPITSSVIDRIVNILSYNMVLTANSEDAQNKLDELIVELKLQEFIRDIFVNTLTTGSNLAVIRITTEGIKIENWDGTYVWKRENLTGYEYTIRDGVMVPVLDESVKEDDRILVIIDENIFGGVAHGLPFNPSTLFTNVDKYESDGMGKSFVMRFDGLVLEFNHIVSQISKAIKVLQNVWVTNRDIDNPENPIRLSPDRINYLGVDGMLEQAVRNLDLKEERNYLEILEHQISRASQVPAELAGLRDAGKLPSGVALSILLQPLTELVERLRNLFVPGIEDFTTKVVSVQYIIDGQAIPTDLEVVVTMNESVLPEDRTAKIEEIILLKKEGLISVEQAQLLLQPILKLNLDGEA